MNTARSIFKVLCIANSCLAQDDVLDGEVILICPREPIPEIYIDARKKTALLMNVYLHNEITDLAEDLSCYNPESYYWYCSNISGRPFRGLDGNGKKMNQGLLCNPGKIRETQKFYNAETIAGADCVKLVWYKEGEYTVYFPEE